MISIKTESEISIMREGGKILVEILEQLAVAVQPGISTFDLEKLARKFVSFYKVKPSFLGYQDFPAALCTSVNDEVVHGVPSVTRILKKDDIISLDMGVLYRGFNVDSALTVPVLGGLAREQWAKDNPELNKLIETTKAALNAGIEQAKVGNRLGKISNAIQGVVEKEGFSVIREMVGHGVGRELHEEPQIPNYGQSGEGPVLEEGMVLAIEPMVSAGDWHLAQDGLTYKTKDGSPAAHFEHTVAVTKNGPLVLTRP
jgi:methionyl aminopeptidase